MVKLLNYNMKLSWNIAIVSLLGILVAGSVSAAIDTDQDGLTDEEETGVYYTDPNQTDTDGDGYSDGVEVRNGFSPLVQYKKMHQVDTDADGLVDLLEIAFKSDLKKADTDGDGVNDFEEVMRAQNPTNADRTATMSRRLEVDLTSQQLKYIVDEKLITKFPVSSGMPKTPTPVGSFEIMYKVPNMRYRGADYDLPNVKWNMAFKGGGYFIHTAYWHNNFGKKTNSHGCVNMRINDAALLYKYIDVGTRVTVIGATPKNGVVLAAK